MFAAGPTLHVYVSAIELQLAITKLPGVQ